MNVAVKIKDDLTEIEKDVIDYFLERLESIYGVEVEISNGNSLGERDHLFNRSNESTERV